jgi:hypothetical protein
MIIRENWRAAPTGFFCYKNVLQNQRSILPFLAGRIPKKML